MTAETHLRALDIRAVGVVRRPDEEAETQLVEVLPEYAEALLGIEQAHELQILYWMHRLTEADRGILRVHPRGDRTRPRRGVFALRSPVRPNPIGSTTVTLEKVEGNRLTVSGLDALDGSPVVDIKIAS